MNIKMNRRFDVYIFDTPNPTVKAMSMSEIISYIKIFGDKYEVAVIERTERKGDKDGEV